MSRRVFLDTSGWLAVLSERESRHADALDAYRTLLRGGQMLVVVRRKVGWPVLSLELKHQVEHGAHTAGRL
jgi:predicted nucleic acid-binding protein